MLVSGVLSSFLDRMTAKAADVDKYMDATVTSSDLAVSRYRQSGDAALIARCRQMILNYAALNARVCAGQTMRLYTKGKGKGVKSRRRNDYLRNPQRGYGPGSKAARWAEQAGDVEEVTDHPALMLLNNANPWQRGTSFAQFCYFQWQIFGRRYVHVVGEGEPESLWCLTAQHVKIIPDREKLIGGFVYGRDGSSEEVFGDDEILYQRLMCSPFNPYDAIGPLHAAMEDADIYSAATTSELATWQNGARPDWVLSVPPGTPEAQIKQLQASINGQMKGPKKRGNFLITSLSDAKNLQFSPREMEYLAGKADLRKTMRSAFGIPESVDENNSANLASALMGHTQYMRYTIGPTINQDAEEWSETLLPKFGIDPGEMWFAYDDCVPADRAETRADIQAFIPAGVWSVNEARAEIGFDTLEDKFADNHLPSSLLSFASSATPGQAAATNDATEDPDTAKPTNAPAADTTAKDTALNGAQVASLVEVATQIANGQLPEKVGLEILLAAFPGIDPARINRIIAGLRNFTPDAPAASGASGGEHGPRGAEEENARSKSAPAPCSCGECKPVTKHAKRARMYTKDDRATQSSIEEEMRRAVEKWYANLANTAKPNESGHFNLDPYQKELEELIRPYIVRMFEQGTAGGMRAIGQPTEDAFSVYPDRAVGFLSQHTVQLAKEVTETVQAELQDALIQGLVEGESIVDRTGRVMEAMGETAPWKAERIARTEGTRAMVEGEREAWKANGIEEVEWLLSAEPCPACEGFAAQFNKPVSINAPFLRVGETFKDSAGQVVTVGHKDITGPPIHPGCRCKLLPVTGY